MPIFDVLLKVSQTELAYSSWSALWSDRVSKCESVSYFSIAIKLTVEHANEPPSFQANSVDMCRPSCIREGDLEVFNHVQDGVIDKQGRRREGWSRFS